jgi:hypothetical protein
MSELKSDKGIKTYTFEPETKMKEMLISSVSVKLGVIKVTSVKKAENKPITEAVSSVKYFYDLPGTVIYILNV